MTPSCDYGDIGYNVYEGMSLTGWAQTTVYRGRVTVKDGVFLGQKGQGRFLHRSSSDRPALA